MADEQAMQSRHRPGFGQCAGEHGPVHRWRLAICGERVGSQEKTYRGQPDPHRFLIHFFGGTCRFDQSDDGLCSGAGSIGLLPRSEYVLQAISARTEAAPGVAMPGLARDRQAGRAALCTALACTARGQHGKCERYGNADCIFILSGVQAKKFTLTRPNAVIRGAFLTHQEKRLPQEPLGHALLERVLLLNFDALLDNAEVVTIVAAVNEANLLVMAGGNQDGLDAFLHRIVQCGARDNRDTVRRTYVPAFMTRTLTVSSPSNAITSTSISPCTSCMPSALTKAIVVPC